MDKIARIRQEIERRKGYISVTHFVEELLSLLDTLSDEPNKSLEEAAEEYSKRVSDGHNYRDLTCGFIAGAEWQESQMVKDEVEGEIFDYVEGLIGNIEFNIDSRFEKGDKVRIIIVKEEV